MLAQLYEKRIVEETLVEQAGDGQKQNPLRFSFRQGKQINQKLT